MLEAKHKNFVAPGFEIEVDGKKLPLDKFAIMNLQINIPVTVGLRSMVSEASQCQFTVAGMYDLKNHNFTESALETLKMGKKIVINGGYSTKSCLFVGYIQYVSTDFSSDEAYITVSGIDSSTLLNLGKQVSGFENQDANQVVKELVSLCTVNGFAKSGSNIGRFSNTKIHFNQFNRSNNEFLNFLARREGYTFAIIHGEVIIKDLLKTTAPIVELTYGESLMSFSKAIDLSHQIGGVKVTGKNDKMEPIEGEVTKCSIGKTGKNSALDLMPKIKDYKMDAMDPIAEDAASLKKIAQSIMNEYAVMLVSGRGMCIGLPELYPGRYIKLSGMDSKTNGTYFLTRVTHSFGSNGYVTYFEVKGAWTN